MELLHESLRTWAALHGKALKPEAVEAWTVLFVNTPHAVLAKALQNVTEDSDRMPAPGNLKKAIRIVREEMQVRPPSTNCECKECDGMGWKAVPHPAGGDYEMAQRCGCHPEHFSDRETHDVTDAQGIKCKLELKTGQFLYRAIDCAEGRMFLATLAKVSGKTPEEAAKLMEKWSQ